MSPRRRYDDDDFDDEDSDDRWRRVRNPASDVFAQLQGPAIGMMAVSGITILLVCVFLPLNLFLAFAAPNQPGRRQNDPEPVLQAVTNMISSAVSVVVNGVILTGGIMMLKQRNYAVALTGAILACVPCCTCCCLGMPFGIWAVVTLMQPEVASTFR
jgi:hypothetical protein